MLSASDRFDARWPAGSQRLNLRLVGRHALFLSNWAVRKVIARVIENGRITTGIKVRAAFYSPSNAYPAPVTGGWEMAVPKIDDELAARNILMVFARYKVTVAGVLRRHQFFEVRDSDFQRGIDAAVARGWIARHERDRYRYILTAKGRDAFSTLLIAKSAIASPGTKAISAEL
jgi:hypothetical protein